MSFNIISQNNEKIFIFYIFDISWTSNKWKFVILSTGSIICASIFAFLQEYVFKIGHFRFFGYMTWIQTLTYVGCAKLEQIIALDNNNNNIKRKAPLKKYIVLSLLNFIGIYFSNWSLIYLSYVTRIIFKSSKLLPVVLTSIFFVGRKYSKLEYLSIFILIVSIVLFTTGDKITQTTFNIKGIFLIMIGITADAFTSNYEEKVFFHELNCSQIEILFYTNILSSVWTFLFIICNGELNMAIVHGKEHPQVIFYIIFFSFMGYWSVYFVLLLIKYYGATIAELCKTFRKILSVVLSFVTFHKSITSYHVLGGFLFIFSFTIKITDVYHKKNHKIDTKKRCQNVEEKIPVV